MTGINPHLMFVNAPQLACSWGSGYFQVNELYTRKMEALPSSVTQHKQSYNP